MSRPTLKSAQTSKPEPTEVEPQDATAEEYALSDELREDSISYDKPPGSPQLWPYQQLPRRMRANFFQYLRNLGALQNVASLRGKSTAADFAAMSDYMTFAADAEDAIRVVAHPSTADRLEAWLDEAPDEDVIGLLMWYIATFQPGEATAS